MDLTPRLYFAQRFRQAGFVIVSRTNTPELALMGTTEPLAFGPPATRGTPLVTGGSPTVAGGGKVVS